MSAYAGLPFKFQIVAENDQGSSPASDWIRILAAETPSAPSTPTKVEASKTHIQIRWQAPSSNGGVIIDYYSVYVKPEGESYTIVAKDTDMFDLRYWIDGVE